MQPRGEEGNTTRACPHCGAPLRLLSEHAETTVLCPQCRRRLVVGAGVAARASAADETPLQPSDPLSFEAPANLAAESRRAEAIRHDDSVPLPKPPPESSRPVETKPRPLGEPARFESRVDPHDQQGEDYELDRDYDRRQSSSSAPEVEPPPIVVAPPASRPTEPLFRLADSPPGKRGPLPRTGDKTGRDDSRSHDDPLSPPPKRPLLVSVFHPAFVRTAIGPWAAIGGCFMLATIPAAVAMNMAAGVLMIIAILMAMPTIFALSYVAGCFFTAVTETAAGRDEIESWGAFDFRENIFSLFGLVYLLITISVLAQIVRMAIAVESSIFAAGLLHALFPIIVLSSLEADSILIPWSPAVWRSLVAHPLAWAAFLLESGLVVIGVMAFLEWSVSDPPSPGRLFVSPFIGSAALLLYARLLGLLSWKITQATRAESEWEQADEEPGAEKED